MIQFNKPEKLNGEQLRQELNDNGVKISNDVFAVQDDGLGNLWLDIAEKDQNKAQSVVEAHIGVTVAPELTIADKLASVGLNLEDLKAALGL
jgi:hypothetical protein